MPIYEYSCQSCGKVIDVLQKFTDPTPETCRECGAANTLTKIVSRSSFVLKGGGWYSDLYSSKKEGSDSSSSSSSSSPAPSSSTPAAAPSTTPAAPSTSTASSSPAPAASTPSTGSKT